MVTNVKCVPSSQDWEPLNRDRLILLSKQKIFERWKNIRISWPTFALETVSILCMFWLHSLSELVCQCINNGVGKRDMNCVAHDAMPAPHSQHWGVGACKHPHTFLTILITSLTKEINSYKSNYPSKSQLYYIYTLNPWPLSISKYLCDLRFFLE